MQGFALCDKISPPVRGKPAGDLHYMHDHNAGLIPRLSLVLLVSTAGEMEKMSVWANRKWKKPKHTCRWGIVRAQR